jgi:pre-mRNA-splicing factor 18
MLDGLSLLKQRTKAQIANARRQSSLPHPILSDRSTLESDIRDSQQRERDSIAFELSRAESVLPSAPVDDSITKQVDSQLVDPWARLVSEFKRQLDSSSNLRILIADDELLDALETDHPTVKFFKSVLSEWRLRLFDLTDEELAQRKAELTNMWYCLFALQPLFHGLNNHSLSRDISIETEAIAEELRKLNFKAALDHYHLLAIGKSLWPIGITQYSIHWKFSCDLIDSDRILHLFNSAPARNAIISIKRLMTKYQEFHQRKTAF